MHLTKIQFSSVVQRNKHSIYYHCISLTSSEVNALCAKGHWDNNNNSGEKTGYIHFAFFFWISKLTEIMRNRKLQKLLTLCPLNRWLIAKWIGLKTPLSQVPGLLMIETLQFDYIRQMWSITFIICLWISLTDYVLCICQVRY